MKKLLILLISGIFIASCGQSDKGTEQNNSETGLENSSEENVSPQLQNESDTSGRLKVDTISSAGSANEAKKNDSLKLDTD